MTAPLLELARYVVLNPLLARIVKRLESLAMEQLSSMPNCHWHKRNSIFTVCASQFPPTMKPASRGICQIFNVVG